MPPKKLKQLSGVAGGIGIFANKQTRAGQTSLKPSTPTSAPSSPAGPSAAPPKGKGKEKAVPKPRAPPKPKLERPLPQPLAATSKWKYGHTPSLAKAIAAEKLAQKAARAAARANRPPAKKAKPRQRKKKALEDDVPKTLKLFDPRNGATSHQAAGEAAKSSQRTSSKTGDSFTVISGSELSMMSSPKVIPEGRHNAITSAKRNSSSADLDNSTVSQGDTSKKPKLAATNAEQTEPFTLFDPENFAATEIHSAEEPRAAQPGEYVEWSDFEYESEEDPDSEDEDSPKAKTASRTLLDESLGYKNPKTAFEIYSESAYLQMRQKYGPSVSEEKMREKIRLEFEYAPIDVRGRYRELAEKDERDSNLHNSLVRSAHENEAKKN